MILKVSVKVTLIDVKMQISLYVVSWQNKRLTLLRLQSGIQIQMLPRILHGWKNSSAILITTALKHS